MSRGSKEERERIPFVSYSRQAVNPNSQNMNQSFNSSRDRVGTSNFTTI